MIVYAGDSRDVVKRIITNHCAGNVEASALRRYVAEAIGYQIKETKRPSGSTRVRINVLDPRKGEEEVSNYLRSGVWRYVICDSYEEANNFQWYVIDRFKPLLNREHRPWNQQNLHRYQALLSKMSTSSELTCSQLHGMRSGPGVYVLYHQKGPQRELSRASPSHPPARGLLDCKDL